MRSGAPKEVLVIFEQDRPDDRRPRAAIDAARTFANGANRSNLQRVTAAEAHRASKEATIEAAQHAANATGDPAVAAYLHPFVRASQVRHIVRAAAHAACAAELATVDLRVGDRRIEETAFRATPVLLDVLHRYPLAPTGKSCVAELMKRWDTSLRLR